MRSVLPILLSLAPVAGMARECDSISDPVLHGGTAAAIVLGDSLREVTNFQADLMTHMDRCKIFVEMVGPDDLSFPRPDEIKAAACSDEALREFVSAGGEVEVTHLMHVTRRPTIATISNCDEAP
jgi:hypothetical protein